MTIPRWLLAIATTVVAATGLTVADPHAQTAVREPHVLMISIDGLMPSSYTHTSPAKIPTIRALAAEGAYADGVVGVLPTVTYPSHTTLITGVPTAIHGITDNRMFDPENKSGGASFWYGRDIHAPTLLGAVHGRGWRTGAVAWPVTVGLDVDFHVPEFWRTNYGADFPEAGSFLRAASTPHLLDAVEIGRGKPLAWKQTDEDRTDIAAFILKTYQPHLMLVHLIDLDSAQHASGPGSPEALQTLERMDAHIGTLVRVLKAAGTYDQTDIAIVSDHGFLPIEQQLHPNVLFKREGLLTVDSSNRIASWQAVYHASGGSGFIHLRDRADRALRERVWALLQTMKADPANGIESVWSTEDLARIGGPQDAVFGIDMRSGFYSGGGVETLLTPTRKGDGGGMRGGHGFSPLRPELQSSLVVRGPSVRTRGSLGVVRMTQIAPTLARWMDVGLSPRADGPIDALIAAPMSTSQPQGK